MRLPSETKLTKVSKYPLESAEQRAAWDWLSTQRPWADGVACGDINLLRTLQDYCYMVPNGTHLSGTGKRRAIQMANLKSQGLRTGISDLVIAYPVGGYHGAYIEMKRVRKAYAGPAAIRAAIRPEQISWLNRMSIVGYWTAVAYGAGEFIELMGMYLRGEPHPELHVLQVKP